MQGSRKILFVTGVGRSGTTLIQSMLNAHSKIYSPPETKYIKRFAIPEFYSGHQSNATFEDKIRANRNLARLDIDIENLLKKSQANNPEGSFLSFYRTLLEELSSKNSDIEFFLDKDPLFINYPRELDVMFPESQLIQIIRDPRDVILSRIKSTWGKKQPFIIHLFETKYGFDKARLFGQKYFIGRFFTLKYEELLEDPTVELKKTCHFLSLSFEEQMLSYHKQSDQIITEEEQSWKGNVLKPILTENKNKWKDGLSNHQIRIIEYMLRSDLVKMKYETSELAPNLLTNALGILLRLIYMLFAIGKNIKIRM